MASNDQAILAEWSKQRDNEDGDEWRWRLGDPPDDICEAYCRVADAADSAAAKLPPPPRHSQAATSKLPPPPLSPRRCRLSPCRHRHLSRCLLHSARIA